MCRAESWSQEPGSGSRGTGRGCGYLLPISMIAISPRAGCSMHSMEQAKPCNLQNACQNHKQHRRGSGSGGLSWLSPGDQAGDKGL